MNNIDKADRLSLHNMLDGALMNIVTGQITHPDVNADDAVCLG